MPNTKGASLLADPMTRKSATVCRLRQHLRRKRESLADHFDFKMYLSFVFRDKKKSCALFEVSDVIPVMTNNYKDSIMKGVKEEAYSLESSQELLEKDVVQLHAPHYRPMRKDIIGCNQAVDFFLWPRKDIDKIVCHLFSRWKEDTDAAYRPVQVEFEFDHMDYEKQLLHLLARRDSTGLIINNPSQSMFLFVDRHNLKTPQNKAVFFKLSSLCLHVQQDQLMHWGPGSIDLVLDQYMPPMN
ncbi:uncharacterized protein C6orf62 homolog [Nematostella vectensis]|uniref:uncharacterized protein C6orf62 homolog n=1 Tax=Nematostella vectensis TaxID=45351 RepID=UPI00207797C7|nr:uncharacterized protein C6orf62 homolog [Nematostella vectensis]